MLEVVHIWLHLLGFPHNWEEEPFFQSEELQWLIPLSTTPAILGVLAILFGIKEKKSLVHKSGGYQSLRRLPKRFHLFLLVVFLFSLGYSSDALLLIKTSEMGINETYIPFVYISFQRNSRAACHTGRKAVRQTRLRKADNRRIFRVCCHLFPLREILQHFVICLPVRFVWHIWHTDRREPKIIYFRFGGQGLERYRIWAVSCSTRTYFAPSIIGGWLYDHVNSSVPFYLRSSFICLWLFLFSSSSGSGHYYTLWTSTLKFFPITDRNIPPET